MGHAVLATKWQRIYRRSAAKMREHIIINVNELDSQRRLTPWNSGSVIPERLNSKFTSMMTQAYSKTKRLTTVIDNKGQIHQLHHSIRHDVPENEFKLPPIFYHKSKAVKDPIVITRTIKVDEQQLEPGKEEKKLESELKPRQAEPVASERVEIAAN